MKKQPFLQKHLRLSDKTYRDLTKAAAACFLTNLSLLLPAAVSLLITMEVLKPLTGASMDWKRLWVLFGAGIAAGIILFFCSRNDYKKTYVTSYQAGVETRMSVAEQIRKLPMHVFHAKDLTELTTNIMGDCASLEQMLSHLVPQLIANTASIAAVCVFFAFWDWRIALALFATLPVAFCIVFFSRRRQEALNRKLVEAKLAASEQTREYLEGIKIIKSCNLDGERFDALKEALRNMKRRSIHTDLGTGILVASAQVVLYAGVGITIFTATALLSGGSIALETVMITLLVAVRIYGPVIAILQLLPELFYMLQATKRMRALAEIPLMEGSAETPVKHFDVAFEDVRFQYNKDEVLRGVSVTIPEKSITALAGPSGSGKSTMARLIARFWDVTGGTVRVGGVDVKTLDPEYLMRHMSFVFQDVVLFHDTVWNNIKIGNMDATDGEILAAAEAAHCDEFVYALPDRYETVLGENGQTLSGGERQRVSIARALLKDAPIVLLDEATASLDPENESLIQEAISRLIKGKTVLVIAHRLRTVTGADQIIVLEDGMVAGTGTHEQLLANCGVYARMFSLQQPT
ncbi:MAG: ABC transporter ATP-binding protein/permease [Clostridium sp.]|jgi:ATP-binding cassette subfamily B protein|nr:ABC transporter ATP-binding protein/permease [Clostridium sp.]